MKREKGEEKVEDEDEDDGKIERRKKERLLVIPASSCLKAQKTGCSPHSPCCLVDS